MKSDFTKISDNHETDQRKKAAMIWSMLTLTRSVSIYLHQLDHLHENNTLLSHQYITFIWTSGTAMIVNNLCDINVLFSCNWSNYVRRWMLTWLKVLPHHNTFTFWHIRLSIYIWKTKFTSHNQYLFGLLISTNAKKTHTNKDILQVLKRLANLQK